MTDTTDHFTMFAVLDEASYKVYLRSRAKLIMKSKYSHVIPAWF
ncbi:hypothetical protein QUF63_08725 [Anaerolineales bacterium HSG25]|nr:hypothetical protein [Anaerolineales bacterium HSG25]